VKCNNLFVHIGDGVEELHEDALGLSKSAGIVYHRLVKQLDHSTKGTRSIQEKKSLIH